jgi:hypothetical protein
MGIYSDLTDAELAAEIAAFRAARRAVILPGSGGVGVVKRITDGDRTLEYTQANLGSLDEELARLLAEQERRANGGYGGRALGVDFD